jgi:hypothetical protein
MNIFSIDWLIIVLCHMWPITSSKKDISFSFILIREWMIHVALEEFKGCMQEGRYAHSCLSSLTWWHTMQYVLTGVEPLYAFPHFVDQGKIPNMSKVLLWFNMCKGEYESLLRDYPTDLEHYMRVIKPRMGDVSNLTFVNAGTCNLYTCNPNVKHKYFSM